MDNHRLGAGTLNDRFFELNWSLYEKILAGNYLFHREGFALLRQQLLKLEAPLRLLDLGCGDARLIPALLEGLEVELYEGVDSSEPALERARDNLVGLPARLTEVDLLARVGQEDAAFTLGMASYSAHHLRPEQRPIFYGRLKALAPRWFFFDVLRPDEDSRETFNTRLLERARHDWASLTEEEYALVSDHIQTSDYPLSQAELLELTEPQGFRLDILWSDPVATGKLFRLQG